MLQHKYYKDGEGDYQVIYVAPQFCRIPQEGNPDILFAKTATEALPKDVQEYRWLTEEIVKNVDSTQYTALSHEDREIDRNLLPTDDDNGPDLENIPTEKEATINAFGKWGCDGFAIDKHAKLPMWSHQCLTYQWKKQQNWTYLKLCSTISQIEICEGLNF